MGDFRALAQKLAVQRAAEAADWDISAEEIATVTNVPIEIVGSIVADAGWELVERDPLPATDILFEGNAR